jgi:hypothetical protein
MKKIISVVLCVMLLFSAVSFTAFAGKDKAKTEETTEFVLEIDVNKRYTDIVEDTDELFESEKEKKELSEGQKTVYIAVLVAALVVSVVILAVSVKRVPKEENIDISGQNKNKKDKE